MEIVFLDEYTICSADISSIKSLGNYTGYSETTSCEDIIARAKDADVIITNKVVIDAQTMDKLPKLRLICIAATGMNNVDLEAAYERGIEVRNAIGYSTHSVVEATLSSALALLREVAYYDNYFKSSNYSHSPRLFNFDRPTRQLHGRHWGIIGLGNIGREVARLAAAFGCEVRYYSTSGTAREEEYEACSLEELLNWADVVSVHAPLNDKTRSLIAERELAWMKSTAIIINVARGGIIDEQALANALNYKAIAGAALDVFSTEPIEHTSPLLTLDDPYRLLASPHNAWSALESIDNLIEAIRQNITEIIPA